MNNSITNVANVEGIFDTRSTGLTSSIVTAMTDDLQISKTADKEMWADGDLTYTVTVTNTSDTFPYETVTFTDTIDPILAELVENSVTLNGIDVQYTYNDTTGLLTVSLDTIPAPGNAVIVFKVIKK